MVNYFVVMDRPIDIPSSRQKTKLPEMSGELNNKIYT